MFSSGSIHVVTHVKYSFTVYVLSEKTFKFFNKIIFFDPNTVLERLGSLKPYVNQFNQTTPLSNPYMIL